MKLAGICVTLFAILLLGGCGGGGGGGGSDSAADTAPTFNGATGIEQVSTSNESIGLVGDSNTSTTVIVFGINDAAGTAVPDGRRVDFSILNQPGGATLSVSEAYTSNGQVSVELRSGTASGPVDVQASYYDDETGQTLTKVVRITIVSGTSDARHLSISAPRPHSMDGGVFNLEKEITINLGDRYGNVVKDGTPVSFMTEGGTIGLSSGFNTSTTSGVASATLRTANPTTPNLGGIAPIVNLGLCRVVAYTSGSESYQDSNGNGIYDGEAIDTFDTASDMGEPFIDANDSGVYENGELYIDTDGNGSYTPKNGLYDKQSTIWTSMNIVFSRGIYLYSLSDTTGQQNGWTIGIEDSKDFSFFISDAYGNTPLDGTTYEITTEYKEVKISNETPKSPLVDLDGRPKHVNFTITTTDQATVNDPITIRVVATLPDGTQVSGSYIGSVR